MKLNLRLTQFIIIFYTVEPRYQNALMQGHFVRLTSSIGLQTWAK